MADVTIDIIARDNFSGVLGNFGSIVTGIESAINLLSQAFRVFADLAAQGLESVAFYERLDLTLSSLAASQALMSGQAETMAEAFRMTSSEAEILKDWMIELAIHSPFTTEGVANAFVMAEAYGFTAEEAQRLIQAETDYAAGSGRTEEAMIRITRALGQISATGKLMGQDMLQLTQVGVPVAQILADAFGVTTAEIIDMRREGLLPAQAVIEAITSWMETNFAGAADKLTTSWAGLTGTFQDLKDLGLLAFFEGMYDALQPLAVELSEFIQGPGLEILRTFGSILGEIAGTVFEKFAGFSESPFVKWLTSLLESSTIIVQNFDGFLGNLEAINEGGAFNLPQFKVEEVIDVNLFAENLKNDITEGIQLALADSESILNQILAPFAIGGAAALAVPLLTAFFGALTGIVDTVAAFGVTSVGEGLLVFFVGLLDVLGPLVAILGPFALGIAAISSAMFLLSEATGGAVPKLSELTGMFLKWTENFDWGQLSDKISFFISSIDWAGLGDEIATNFTNIFGGISNIIEGIDFQQITTYIKQAVEAVDWTGVGQALGEGIRQLGTAIGGAVAEIDWWGLLSSIVTGLGEALAGLIGGIFGVEVSASFEDATAQWRGFFDGFSTWINNWASGVWDSIVDGFNRASLTTYRTITYFFKHPFEVATEAVKEFLGISSPSSLFFDIGKDIIQGLINGLVSMWGIMKDALLLIFGKLLEPWQPILDLLGIDISDLLSSNVHGTSDTISWPPTEGSTGTSAQTVNNYFYGTVYFMGAGEPGSYYDCPSPNPLMNSTSGTLQTQGFAP